jgi:hypothetical protein
LFCGSVLRQVFYGKKRTPALPSTTEGRAGWGVIGVDQTLSRILSQKF